MNLKVLVLPQERKFLPGGKSPRESSSPGENLFNEPKGLVLQEKVPLRGKKYYNESIGSIPGRRFGTRPSERERRGYPIPPGGKLLYFLVESRG